MSSIKHKSIVLTILLFVCVSVWADANNFHGYYCPTVQISPMQDNVVYTPAGLGVVTSKAGSSTDPVTGKKEFNDGIDLAANLNDRVYNLMDGVVTKVGWRDKMLGVSVEIYHPYPNVRTIYSHLNAYSVVSGQWVKRGQVIGFAGSTGKSGSVHLHYTVIREDTKQYVEPMAFLAQVPKYVAALKTARAQTVLAANMQKYKEINNATTEGNHHYQFQKNGVWWIIGCLVVGLSFILYVFWSKARSMIIPQGKPLANYLPEDQRKLHDVNITQAITYPILRKNWINTLLLPGIVSVIVCQSQATETYGYLVVLFVLLPPLMGYGWRLISILRKNGYDAPAPDWTLEKIVSYWWDGLKLMLLIALPVALMLVPMSLHLPEVEKKSPIETAKDQKAVQHYTEIINSNPKNFGGYCGRYEAYMNLGNQDESFRDIRKLTDLGFDYGYEGKLSDLWKEMWKIEIRQCIEAIKVDPSYAWAYKQRGDAYRMDDQPQKAIEDYSKAISLDRSYLTAYKNRSEVYYALKKYWQGLKDVVSILCLNPKEAVGIFKPYEDHLRTAMVIVSMVFCIALMPFFWGAMVQAEETRELLQLINFPRLVRAGKQCYKKSLLVSLVIMIGFPLCLGMLVDVINEHCERFIFLFGVVFVLIIFTSFHLIAQAYDAYR